MNRNPGQYSKTTKTIKKYTQSSIVVPAGFVEGVAAALKEKPVAVPEPKVSPPVCGVDATVATGLPN